VVRILFQSINLATNNFSQPLLIGNNDNESGGGAMSFAGGKSDPEALAKQNANFACPPARSASARIKAGLPAWRYRYMAAYWNTAMGGNSTKAPVSAHGSELSVVWGTMDNTNKGVSTPDEVWLSGKIRKAWAAFAKDPSEGLTKLGWPIYDEKKPTLVLLGEESKADIKFVSPDRFDGVCGTYWKNSTTARPSKRGRSLGNST
jgi:cholinesterase